MKPSTLCLPEHEIPLLLSGELPPDEVAAAECHLAECAMCRDVIESTIADTDWWINAKRSLATCNAGNRVCSEEARDSEQTTTEQVLELLGPTDDPSMLGRVRAYEIVGVLGRGGMGAVFKGHDGALNRFVAIKMLLPHLAASGAARRRFAREAQAAAAVVDDHVMAIHGVDEWKSVPYFVMPYARGVSLQKRLSQEGPLQVREVLRIGMQTAKGLAAAHAQGLVHRDVKPANIFLEEGVERVQLMDFGLARAVDDASLTRSGVLAGTPQYMSPEQARAETIDHCSDLFSLGSVLYAMCTGHAPFRAESSYSVLRLISDQEPRRIREVNTDIPEWLCAIISKLMSKHASDRFESAAEVADLLEDCLAHVQEPTSKPMPASVAKIVKIASITLTSRRGKGFESNTSNAPTGGKPSPSDPESLSGFRFPSIGRTIVAAGFAFSLIFAGVLIALELNKGTLRIESDIDDVPIRIRQAEKVVEQLTVSRQGKTVRVAAGNYIVELDGEFNDLSIADGVFTIRRGDVAAVKVEVSKAKDLDEGKVSSTALAAIKNAIERDSAISDRQWRSLDARRQAIDHKKVTGTPLTFLFLTMQAPKPLSKSMLDELSVLDAATAAGILSEIERKESPYSIMHADRIEAIECEIDKDEAVGTFSFVVPGLCKGKIGYRAKRTDSGWKMTEFRLPVRGVHLVRDGALWESKTMGASEQAVTDGERLQGEWCVTSLRAGARDADVATCDACKYVFTEERLTIIADQESVAEVTLHADSTPKAIDLKAIEGDGAKTLYGIYRFDGDRLELCLGDERPTHFSGEGEAGLLLLTRAENAAVASLDTQTQPVDFVLGTSNFASGDQIEIQSVTTSGSGFDVGATVTVKGTYTLTSEDTANLCFTSTQWAGETPARMSIPASQRVEAMRGKHTFTLSQLINRIGTPHVSFYHQETGDGMGGVSFSQKEAAGSHSKGKGTGTVDRSDQKATLLDDPFHLLKDQANADASPIKLLSIPVRSFCDTPFRHLIRPSTWSDPRYQASLLADSEFQAAIGMGLNQRGRASGLFWTATAEASDGSSVTPVWNQVLAKMQESMTLEQVMIADQLRFQQLGPSVLLCADPFVADALQLTGDQRDQIANQIANHEQNLANLHDHFASLLGTHPTEGTLGDPRHKEQWLRYWIDRQFDFGINAILSAEQSSRIHQKLGKRKTVGDPTEFIPARKLSSGLIERMPPRENVKHLVHVRPPTKEEVLRAWMNLNQRSGRDTQTNASNVFVREGKDR